MQTSPEATSAKERNWVAISVLNAMPHYFFHVKEHGRRTTDEEGTELADDKMAWQEATRACGEMLKDVDGKLAPGPEWRMDVSSADGTLLFCVKFQGVDYRPSPSPALSD